MQAIRLSDEATILLRKRFADEWVDVTAETRPLFEELVEAGLMMRLHTFAGGPNSGYRLTDAACDLRARQLPSAGEVPAPRG